MNSPASHVAQVCVPPIQKRTDFTVTIAICTRDRSALLERCLKAVVELKPQADEVLVVDNSAGNRETKNLARKFSARYVVEATPGLSHARNRGMAESNTEIVAYLDDDATPNERWLEFLLPPFTDPQVAAVTGEIILPGSVNGSLNQDAPRTLANRDPLWFEMATFGGLGSGSNMALRKAACAGKPAFDARLGRGAPIRIGEESHAFASLLSRGYRAVHVPGAIVVHPATSEDIERQAVNSIAYWLLLFSEFSDHRLDLLRFLSRRIRRKPLTWPRNPQAPGQLITSGWRVYLKAGLRGGLLFLHARKLRGK